MPSNYAIPVSIIIAGMIIGGAVLYTDQSERQSGLLPETSAGSKREAATAVSPTQRPSSKPSPVGPDDHILGNPNAAVVIIEYSDLECPFCKSFHPTMHRIIDEYGKDGRLAWVYRHLPLDQIHSRARKEAGASECAAELGGNSAFWNFIDRLFEITPSNNGLEPSLLPRIAEDVGLDADEFQSCLDSGRWADKIEADARDAFTAGARGTPYSLIIAPSGDTVPIEGAQQYSIVKEMVEAVLEAN